MKKLIAVALIAVSLLTMTIDAYAGWVNGYYRKSGTYVSPHYRSNPNSTVRDNYSYYGNRNPSTGKIGTNKYYNNPTSQYYNPYRSLFKRR
ncbi:MAG: hypothetical protein ISS34_02970 [Candidatus Omnitrophica bacterium]|nr:hypothetical protein [Candidatus Omnitrophota bacterium]